MHVLREVQPLGYEGKRSILRAYLTQVRKMQGLPPRSRNSSGIWSSGAGTQATNVANPDVACVETPRGGERRRAGGRGACAIGACGARNSAHCALVLKTTSALSVVGC